MKKSKAILMALCAVLLVAASVMGTLAYLTSTDTVTNTFTVGKVEITLDEAKVSTDGTPVQGAARVDANEYHLLPGHTYTKDPIVHVAAGSSDCFLFVKVDNQIAAIEDENNTVAGQMKANGWLPVGGKPGVYVLTYTEKDRTDVETGSVLVGDLKVVSAAAAQVNVPVFEKFKIADDVNNEENVVVEGENPTTVSNDRQLSKFDNSQIIVTAYAVQADGFDGKTAAQIWTAANFT